MGATMPRDEKKYNALYSDTLTTEAISYYNRR